MPKALIPGVALPAVVVAVVVAIVISVPVSVSIPFLIAVVIPISIPAAGVVEVAATVVASVGIDVAGGTFRIGLCRSLVAPAGLIVGVPFGPRRSPVAAQELRAGSRL